jgi:hypothetical protein
MCCRLGAQHWMRSTLGGSLFRRRSGSTGERGAGRVSEVGVHEQALTPGNMVSALCHHVCVWPSARRETLQAGVHTCGKCLRLAQCARASQRPAAQPTSYMTAKNEAQVLLKSCKEESVPAAAGALPPGNTCRTPILQLATSPGATHHTHTHTHIRNPHTHTHTHCARSPAGTVLEPANGLLQRCLHLCCCALPRLKRCLQAGVDGWVCGLACGVCV